MIIIYQLPFLLKYICSRTPADNVRDLEQLYQLTSI